MIRPYGQDRGSGTCGTSTRILPYFLYSAGELLEVFFGKLTRRSQINVQFDDALTRSAFDLLLLLVGQSDCQLVSSQDFASHRKDDANEAGDCQGGEKFRP